MLKETSNGSTIINRNKIYDTDSYCKKGQLAKVITNKSKPFKQRQLIRQNQSNKEYRDQANKGQCCRTRGRDIFITDLNQHYSPNSFSKSIYVTLIEK